MLVFPGVSIMCREVMCGQVRELGRCMLFIRERREREEREKRERREREGGRERDLIRKEEESERGVEESVDEASRRGLEHDMHPRRQQRADRYTQ
jgi:hypothetical protein